MSRDAMSASESSESAQSPQPDRKRKRNADQEDELEIDLNLPEPPSKKALRKLKKAKSDDSKPAKAVDDSIVKDDSTPSTKETASAKSEWAIWIGNMLWTTTRDDLRGFFTDKGGIAQDAITRVHMPPPKPTGPTWKGPKPVNKGFAYVDFATEADMLAAIGLSESLLAGRKVLIKNAKSFEGRPDEKAGGTTTITSEKAPSRRVFVGNLTFDATIEDVREHFTQAGQVDDVFLTTFEDSGKCKGYGWVRFAELEAAQAAVTGYIFKTQDADESDDEKESTKSKKLRKWFINRLQGRTLRCEFAEDAQSRYKKRFSKGTSHTAAEDGEKSSDQRPQRPSKKLDKDDRQALRRKKHEDARLVAPGQALARAQRASAAVVASTGKKISFD